MARGRPSGTITELRRRVLSKLDEADSLGALVRSCQLRDRSNARRILKDLWKLDLITPPAFLKNVKLSPKSEVAR